MGCSAIAGVTGVAFSASPPPLHFTSFDEGLPPTGQWRNQMAVGDMNGDGIADLVHGPRRKGDGNPSIFLGDGIGGWTRWATTFDGPELDYGAAAVADFNDDGKTDCAFAAHLRGIAVFLGDGKGTFTAAGEGLPYGAPGASFFSSRVLKAADWNGDGAADLISLSEGGIRALSSGVVRRNGLAIFINDGVTWRAQYAAAPADVNVGDALAVGALNGDGRPDVFMGSTRSGYTELMFHGDGEAGGTARSLDAFPRQGFVWAVALGDLDGDGAEDLVWSEERTANGVNVSRVLWARVDGAEPAVTLWTGAESERATSVATGDWDGDGSVDVAVGTTRGRVLLLASTRGMDPTSANAEDGGCTCYDVVAADLDEDGTPELIATFAGETAAHGLSTEPRCERGGAIRIWKIGTSHGK